jgi:hypothetical protein
MGEGACIIQWRGEKCIIYTEKPEGNRLLGRLRSRRGIIILEWILEN